MLQLQQSSFETIPLLTHDKSPLIDIVSDQMYGHPLVQPLHIPAHNKKISNLVGIIAGRYFLQLETPICAFTFDTLVLHQEVGSMGLRFVPLVDDAPLYAPV